MKKVAQAAVVATVVAGGLLVAAPANAAAPRKTCQVQQASTLYSARGVTFTLVKQKCLTGHGAVIVWKVVRG